MGRDQMDNAKRIEHHHIGLAMDIDQVSADTLVTKIQALFVDRKIKGNILQMKLLFQKANRSEKEVELVRALLK
jgi:UDP:flavonoid glycosyltransferase YjiC (YdhE family)